MTRAYQDFCQAAFGRFLHHTPDEGSDSQTREALARTYALSAGGALLTGAVLAGATSANAGSALFTIDQTLGIDQGHTYSSDALAELARVHAKAEERRTQDSGGGGGCGGGVSCDGGNSGSGSGGCAAAGDGGGGCGGGS
jgi:hypothetical protein